MEKGKDLLKWPVFNSVRSYLQKAKKIDILRDTKKNDYITGKTKIFIIADEHLLAYTITEELEKKDEKENEVKIDQKEKIIVESEFHHINLVVVPDMVRVYDEKVKKIKKN